MEKKLHLRVVTPDTVKLDEEVDMVIMRCTTGDMGILPQRGPVSAILDVGVLRIKNGDAERRMAVSGGVAQVLDDDVLLLCNDAYWPDDIDHAEAQAEREEAEKRISEAEDNMHVRVDQVALRRALVRIEVSSYPLLRSGKLEEDED
jgi:F-type H+-transporting ATPase subunit epsilon